MSFALSKLYQCALFLGGRPCRHVRESTAVGQAVGGAKSPGLMPIKTLSDEDTRSRTEPMRLFNTVVHNCECHTFDDVTFGLMRIVGLGLRDAERKSREIDFFGSGTVATTPLEVAEMYAQRLHTEVVSRSGTLLQTSIVPA